MIVGASTVAVRDSNFTSCSAPTNGYRGGAAFIQNSYASFTHVHFDSCYAHQRGGAVYALNGAEVDLAGVMFSSNSAYYYGGAMFIYGATASLSSVEFDGNSGRCRAVRWVCRV